MNNIIEQAKKAIPILQAILANSPRVKTRPFGKWVSPTKEISASLEEFLDGWKIEKLQFPKPPEGERWHNPERLTAEQVGVDKGWRLLLVSEREERERGWVSGKLRETPDIQMRVCSGAFVEIPCYGDSGGTSYRTKLPLPKQAVEMTVAEIEKALGKKIKIVKDLI